MASVTLPNPDLALFSNLAGARVVIPHLVAAPRTRRREMVLVQFETASGQEAQPTAFRGVGRARSYDLTARYVHDEHDEMAALIDLLEAAHEAPDGRLALRTNFFEVGSLNPFEVVTVSDVTEQHLGGKAWDVRMVASTVAYSLTV